MNKQIIRSAQLRALTDENKQKREAEFVISTEAVDSYGTVFKLDGWDLEQYRLNPVVCFNHRSGSDNPDAVIGTSEVFIEDGQLIGRVRFEDAETNPMAEKIFKKVQAGTLRMASIHAVVEKYHWGNESLGENREVLYFDQMRLMEWSIVTIGSNPDALKRNAEAMDEFKKELEKPEGENRSEDNKELDIFEAQLIINQNL